MQAQKVDFVSIPTRDLDRAATFYGGTLGFGRDPLSNSTWPEFTAGNVTLAVVVPEQIGMDLVPLPTGAIAIRVPDVADARAELEQQGIAFEGDTFDSGVCHMAFFRDPDGNGLMLHHRYKPYHDGSTP